MAYENVRYEADGTIVTLTIDREKALNALNAHTLNELTWALREVESDARVRAVVLTGAGEKAFVAGADIAEMSTLSAAEARTFAELGHALGDLIGNMSKPVIAAVGGYALGGGCELAMACDFIYASEKAKFGQPEVNLGVMAGFGGTQRLARLIGLGRAMELLLSGDTLSAGEALRVGLVNAVFPPEKLLEKACAKAHQIAEKAPLAIAYTKRSVRRAAELSLAAGCELERDLFALLFSTQDQKEGMRAFLDKRPAQFTGK
jgi:enoyl-CoA hydratase